MRIKFIRFKDVWVWKLELDLDSDLKSIPSPGKSFDSESEFNFEYFLLLWKSNPKLLYLPSYPSGICRIWVTTHEIIVFYSYALACPLEERLNLNGTFCSTSELHWKHNYKNVNVPKFTPDIVLSHQILIFYFTKPFSWHIWSVSEPTF